MSRLDRFFGLINRPVGNNMDNDQEDVLAIKFKLNRAGYFDSLEQAPEPHGFITKEMDIGIQEFQKDKGLKVDGILLPRGETEKALLFFLQAVNEKKQGKMSSRPTDKIEREVLPSQPNNLLRKLIPGTNVLDEGVWEGEIQNKNRFDFKPDDTTVPIPQIRPPRPNIDPTMEIPYDPSEKRFFPKYKDA